MPRMPGPRGLSLFNEGSHHAPGRVITSFICYPDVERHCLCHTGPSQSPWEVGRHLQCVKTSLSGVPHTPDMLQLDTGRWKLLTTCVCLSILECAPLPHPNSQTNIEQMCGRFGDLLVIGRRIQNSRATNDSSG